MNMIDKSEMISKEQALTGRNDAIALPALHYVNKRPLAAPYPSEMQLAMFGLGCFWGAERKFWECEGVYITLVGYAAGYTPNPSYQEVCSGMTGHNEVVFVVFDPTIVSYEQLLTIFWQSHNPTQGMQQGNDRGTQYRSGVYTYNQEQHDLAVKTRDIYQDKLNQEGHGTITTEIVDASAFYAAEEYHQQYLAKNPGGYCGLGGTGVLFS